MKYFGSVADPKDLATKEYVDANTGSGGSMTHNVWLMDYKTFGEDSYVFNDKDVLHELYLDYPLVMNDAGISGEALDWLSGEGRSLGEALAACYGIDSPEVLSELDTMGEILASSAAMETLEGSAAAVVAVLTSSVGAAARDALFTSPAALAIICRSSAASDAIKTVVQPYAQQIVTALGTADSAYFTHFTYAVGNYSEVTNAGCDSYDYLDVGSASTNPISKYPVHMGNTILIPYKASASSAGASTRSLSLYYGTDQGHHLYTHSSGTKDVTGVASFRGAYEDITGGYNYAAFHVYTAK